MITIETLGPEAAARHVPGLAAVLTDCVTKGASVSFMNPYTQADGEAYFSRVAASVAAGDTVLVAAFLGERIIGTAQLGLDMPPNQPHRAEVKKMLVHSDGRRQGIAGSLLRRVEDEALARDRTLLILDTGSEEARRVYERGGWSRFGFVRTSRSGRMAGSATRPSTSRTSPRRGMLRPAGRRSARRPRRICPRSWRSSTMPSSPAPRLV